MKIAVLFTRRDVRGTVRISNGSVGLLKAFDGTISDRDFHLPHGGRLEVFFSEFTLNRGAFSSICHVQTDENPFSFNLRDVTSATPIFIPEYEVAVVPGNDERDYGQVAAAIASRGLVSDFTRFENEPEESYAGAACLNRTQYCPTWLGLGRDMRMFRVGYQENFGFWGQIQPHYHTVPQHLPDAAAPKPDPATAYDIKFVIGQGSSCQEHISRRLEDGTLPILHSTQAEQDVRYDLTMFATLEKEPIREGNIRGSEWEACYAYTGGNMLSPEQKTDLHDLMQAEVCNREQEVVCCLRVEAINTGKVPRYAWFKGAHISGLTSGSSFKYASRFEDGFSILEDSGKVYAVHRMDREPLPQEEMAVLLQPGEKVTFDIFIPHSAIDAVRAEALMKLDFHEHLEACRQFWRERLSSAAGISVPEPPINESIQAGLLHCDLVALGCEPDGPVLATIGQYSPIGTESAPIIQFFDSMGWHKLAERCIDFFFARQRSDGFIQNYGGYQSETGPLLWTAGEHFRYTRDIGWLKRVLPNLKKATDYLLEWRERNKRSEYREKGFYGMVDGKVADPEDFYHSFFLNAGTYIGLKRIAEILHNVDADYAGMLDKELPQYLHDIRTGFHFAQERAPVMPLPDGSWAPLMPPWVEYCGGISFYADGGNWYSHGAFASRSCLTGPLWLIICEILEPDEIGAEFMMKTNQYPVTLENAALSQPYYCRHDYAHIRRGEVSAFLKTYYNQITALQDRETYTFWEHYFHASQHKTHEEAWFLMQTRWMLWLEEGWDLHLLSAVPRAWLADGESISLKGVKSYFGAIWLETESDLQRNRIAAEIRIESDTPPERVTIHLPHPEHRRAQQCSGGIYDPERERIYIDQFRGSASVQLLF